jgi:hypothetical protein
MKLFSNLILILVLLFSVKFSAQTQLCIGQNNQSNYNGAGGSWNSSNSSVATVDASGLVAAVNAGNTTITYQTGSNSNQSLFWNFESGATNQGGGIFKYAYTTASNSTYLTGFITQTGGNGTYENQGASVGMVLVQRQFSTSKYPYIQFTTTVSGTLNNISFTHRHNHNAGQSNTAPYNVQMQLSISNGAWTNVGSAISCSSGNHNTSATIQLGNVSIPAGTHKLRWVRVSGSTNADYFALNNVTFNCALNTYNVLFSQNYTVNALPTFTSTTGASICVTGTATLQAAAAAGTINWYAAASGGASLGTGTSYTTPNIATTTTYYAQVTNNGCTSSPRTAVVATVNAIPSLSSTTGASRCGTGTVTLQAAAAAGTINWYATSTGGASLGTGTSFTTPSINTTTTYYADVTSNGCTSSPRTAVVATVNALPTFTSTTGASICGSGPATLQAATSAGTITWYATSTGGASLGTGTSFTTPSINTTTTYYADVSNNGCTSTPRVAITASVSPLPNASSGSLNVELLVVGGGGGAGYARGGGGGGGGYIAVPSYTVTGGSTIPITVGIGGSPGTTNANTGVHATSGTNSSFGSTHIAIGGGGGGSYGGGPQNGYNGGSGGGGANQSSSANTGFGGTGTAGQGFSGGKSRCGGGGEVSGGGGGGAGGAGSNGTSSNCGSCNYRPYTPGKGGNGIQNSITGSAVWYAGGGGGGGLGANPIANNCTSGAQNIHGTNGLGGGQASFGGGGQCKVVSNNFVAESGGPGIVVVKYAGTPVATGGTITQVGGYTIHTFTSNGTFTVPVSAVANNTSRCGPGTVTFTGSSSNGYSLNWYDASTGGNLLASNTIGFITPSINATTTYYTSIVNTVTGCESATRTAVTATVNTGGTASSNQTVCPGLLPNSIQLTGNSGTIQWQTSNDNVTFTNIAGQTTSTLAANAIGVMAGVKYIRAMVNGACIAPSNVVTLSPASLNILTPLTAAAFVWNGQNSTQWGTLANWYAYNGSHLAPAVVLPSSNNTIIVPPNGSCVLNQPTFASGLATMDNIILETGSQFTQTGGLITVNGDYINNGTLNASGGIVHFNGSSPSSISGTGSIQFSKMRVNKSAGATLTLQAPVVISDSLYMQQGNIFTSANHILTLGISSVSPGKLAWNNGTIVGPFRRYFANAATSGSDGMFPVGTASYYRYADISFSASPGANQYLTVQYNAGAPLASGLPLYNGLPLWASGSLIQNYSADGYWNIIPTNNDYTSSINNAAYNITLSANNLTGMQTPQVCRIIKSAGSNTANQHHVAWQACGTHTPINGGASPLSFLISSTASQGFSWFNIGTPNSQALPVEFAGMTTTCVNETVNIKWTTESEHNNDYFRLEKSADGITWDILGYVDAVGNSSVLNRYEYLDLESRSNTYYRLYQVDQDGSEEMLSTLYSDCDAETSEIASFPNPSHETLSIYWKQFNTSGDGTITIRDINGKTMYRETVALSLGANLFMIKAHLAPGVYMIELMDDNYEQRLIKHVVN